MRPWWALLLLSGCLGAAPAGPAAGPAAEACPLVFPDGTPADCDAYKVTEPQPAPAFADGWRCVREYVDGEHAWRYWVNIDGRHGAQWTSPLWNEGPHAFYRAAFYGESEGWVVIVPHQETAFAELPAAPSGNADFHLTTRQIRLFERAPDQDEWHLVDDADLIIDAYGANEWVGLRVDGFVIDLMRPDPDPDERNQWGVGGNETFGPDGTEYIADVRGNGIKYLNTNLAADQAGPVQRCTFA